MKLILESADVCPTVGARTTIRRTAAQTHLGGETCASSESVVWKPDELLFLMAKGNQISQATIAILARPMFAMARFKTANIAPRSSAVQMV
jgi:hypothetical protein